MSRFFSEKYKELEPYVPGEQPRERKFIKLNTNESPFPPSPLAQRMAREEAGILQLYSDPSCRSLVLAAANCLGVEENQVIFTNGSDDILNFAFMAFSDAGHPVVFPDITYGFYPVFAKLNNIPYETIPLREDFTINVEDYIGIGKNIFIANPNAPTGIALPLCDIERIVASNPDNVVVIDEAYVDFGGESAIGLIDKYKNLLVTQTFSKSRSLAGARLGMGFACSELIQDLETVRYSTNPYNINRMTMAAGVGALTDKEYFIECTSKIRATRERISKKLKEMGFFMTESRSNFIFAAHPAISGLDTYLKLKDMGILVRHFETPRLKNYNRITVGSDAEMDALCDALAEILKAPNPAERTDL